MPQATSSQGTREAGAFSPISPQRLISSPYANTALSGSLSSGQLPLTLQSSYPHVAIQIFSSGFTDFLHDVAGTREEHSSPLYVAPPTIESSSPLLAATRTPHRTSAAAHPHREVLLSEQVLLPARPSNHHAGTMEELSIEGEANPPTDKERLSFASDVVRDNATHSAEAVVNQEIFEDYVHELENNILDPTLSPNSREHAVRLLGNRATQLFRLCSSLHSAAQDVDVPKLQYSMVTVLPLDHGSKAAILPGTIASGGAGALRREQQSIALSVGSQAVTEGGGGAAAAAAGGMLLRGPGAAVEIRRLSSRLALSIMDGAGGAAGLPPTGRRQRGSIVRPFTRTQRYSHSIHSESEMVNHYAVLRVLGHGATARVYLCTDCNTGHLYAMKSVPRPRKRGAVQLRCRPSVSEADASYLLVSASTTLSMHTDSNLGSGGDVGSNGGGDRASFAAPSCTQQCQSSIQQSEQHESQSQLQAQQGLASTEIPLPPNITNPLSSHFGRASTGGLPQPTRGSSRPSSSEAQFSLSASIVQQQQTATPLTVVVTPPPGVSSPPLMNTSANCWGVQTTSTTAAGTSGRCGTALHPQYAASTGVNLGSGQQQQQQQQQPKEGTRAGPQDDLVPVEREVRILRRLNHPNIVQLREVIDDEDESMIHLIMTYASGGPITMMKPYNPEIGYVECVPVRPLSRLLHYSRQVIDALGYMHRHLIVHNDIKPDNILLAENDRVLLADFGESIMLPKTSELDMNCSFALGNFRWIQQQQQQRRQSTNHGVGLDISGATFFGSEATPSWWAEGSFCPESSMFLAAGVDTDGRMVQRSAVGTPAFAAPELIGQNECCFKADVWSLGVTLFAAFFGRLPFSDSTVAGTFKAVLQAPLIFPAYAEMPDAEDISEETYNAWVAMLSRVLVRSVPDRCTLNDLANDPLFLRESWRPFAESPALSPAVEPVTVAPTPATTANSKFTAPLPPPLPALLLPSPSSPRAGHFLFSKSSTTMRPSGKHLFGIPVVLTGSDSANSRSASISVNTWASGDAAAAVGAGDSEVKGSRLSPLEMLPHLFSTLAGEGQVSSGVQSSTANASNFCSAEESPVDAGLQTDGYSPTNPAPRTRSSVLWPIGHLTEDRDDASIALPQLMAHTFQDVVLISATNANASPTLTLEEFDETIAWAAPTMDDCPLKPSHTRPLCPREEGRDTMPSKGGDNTNVYYVEGSPANALLFIEQPLSLQLRDEEAESVSPLFIGRVHGMSRGKPGNRQPPPTYEASPGEEAMSSLTTVAKEDCVSAAAAPSLPILEKTRKRSAGPRAQIGQNSFISAEDAAISLLSEVDIIPQATTVRSNGSEEAVVAEEEGVIVQGDAITASTSAPAVTRTNSLTGTMSTLQPPATASTEAISPVLSDGSSPACRRFSGIMRGHINHHHHVEEDKNHHEKTTEDSLELSKQSHSLTMENGAPSVNRSGVKPPFEQQMECSPDPCSCDAHLECSCAAQQDAPPPPMLMRSDAQRRLSFLGKNRTCTNVGISAGIPSATRASVSTSPSVVFHAAETNTKRPISSWTRLRRLDSKK